MKNTDSRTANHFKPARAKLVAGGISGLIAFCALPGLAIADGESPTLDKIRATKSVSIGYRKDAAPFSYIDDKGEVIGYTTDLCYRIIDKIRDHLGLDKLDVVAVPSTAATRFVLVKTGKVDLECTTTTNTAERRQQAEFTYPDFMTATRFVSKKSNQLDSIESLRGKSVVSTTGTVNVGQLNAVNLNKNLNISVMLAKTHSEAFDLVTQERASAFVMDGILLADLIASSDAPGDYVLSTDAFSAPEPYGILMPKGDLVFKDLVNGALEEIYTSGEIHDIYKKWFLSPIPPDGRNLNLPPTPELTANFADPQEYLK